MHLRMQNAETLNPEQIRGFLETGDAIRFASQGRAETYAWAQQLLVAQEYACQGKKERGAIRAYLSKMTGLSMAQTARLIQMYRETGVVELKPSQRHEFSHKYTDADIALLAELDRAHERLSGPATRCILQREYQKFGKVEYSRLAQISVGHLYNLRNSTSYRQRAADWEPTRPTAVSIGERRKPDPKGRPGFLRVDTVHQGDWDGARGYITSTRWTL
jgi:transposase